MTGTLPLGGGAPWMPPPDLERQGDVTPKPISSLAQQEGMPVAASTSGEVNVDGANVAAANDSPRVLPASVGLVSVGPYSDAPAGSRVPGPLKPGDMLDGYRIIKEIGCGGYARVYKAYDEFIDTYFAIKVIFRPSANAKELDRRTKAEARFLWSVDHPYVVRVHAAGLTEAQSLYFVMELLVGRSLRSILLRRGKLRWQDALPLFAKIAEGVNAAHTRSVIHRDLKPENIFVLKDGTPKVLDFGIAKFVDAPPITIREHIFHGTPPYMSPEQLSGRPVTYQSDVYALGIVLWEVLAGTHPMMSADGDNDPNSVAYRHIYSHPPLVSEVEPSVGKPIARLVNRMISKVPSQRPASMPEVAKELMRCHEKCLSAQHGFFGAITTGRVRVKAADLEAPNEQHWFEDGDPAPIPPAAQCEPAEDAAAERLKLRVGFTREFSTKLLSQLRLRPASAASDDPHASLSKTARPQNPKGSTVLSREGKAGSLVVQLLVLAVGGLSLGGALMILAMHLMYARTKPDTTVGTPTLDTLPLTRAASTPERVDSTPERADSTPERADSTNAAPGVASSVTPSVTAPVTRAVAKAKPKASNADRFLKVLEAELAQRSAAKAAAKKQAAVSEQNLGASP